MTPEEHKQRHIELHKALDELVADYIQHTDKFITNTNLQQLIEWSFKQTLDPTEED
jgi:hypothetical protein